MRTALRQASNTPPPLAKARFGHVPGGIQAVRVSRLGHAAYRKLLFTFFIIFPLVSSNPLPFRIGDWAQDGLIGGDVKHIRPGNEWIYAPPGTAMGTIDAPWLHLKLKAHPRPNRSCERPLCMRSTWPELIWRFQLLTGMTLSGTAFKG